VNPEENCREVAKSLDLWNAEAALPVMKCEDGEGIQSFTVDMEYGGSITHTCCKAVSKEDYHESELLDYTPKDKAPNVSSLAEVAASKAFETSSWMKDATAEVKSLKMLEISMPATHESLSYDLALMLPLHPHRNEEKYMPGGMMYAFTHLLLRDSKEPPALSQMTILMTSPCRRLVQASSRVYCPLVSGSSM